MVCDLKAKANLKKQQLQTKKLRLRTGGGRRKNKEKYNTYDGSLSQE